MTLEEMKAVAAKADQIQSKLRLLEQAEERLALVNKFGKEGQVWRPLLCLKEGERWGGRSVDIAIDIPFGVIQQQAVDAVKRIKRELVLLGYQA